MIGNAHIDPVWLWPWREGYQEARATFRSAVDRMAEYEDFRFTCDQMVLLAWVEESEPELFDAIRGLVAEGRWVNAGGWWVEPDCNTPSGESLARQGLIGQRYLASRFGRPATAGLNADPFGHNAMLPQILRLQGLDSYTFLRPGPHESPMPHTAFHWESPDGSRILSFRIPHEYCSPPGSLAGQIDKALGAADRGLPELMVFYGVGNHGGGPTRENIDSIHRFDTMGSFGRLRLSDPEAFFADLRAALGAKGLARLPVWRDDLQTHAAGCFSAHSHIKRWQLRAQQAALAAERWALIASHLSGGAYPRDDLRRAWEQICFNQFHDILPGSAIESAYEDARDQLGEAASISDRITTWAHNQIARRTAIPPADQGSAVVVFNSHPWPVAADVELQYGGQPLGVHLVDAGGAPTLSQPIQSLATTDDRSRGAVAFRAQLPALGHRVYLVRSGARPAGQAWTAGLRPLPRPADGDVLENEFLRVRFDRATGYLVSLLDKRSGADPISGAVGPHTQLSADPTDTWGHRVVSYAGPGAELRLVEAGLAQVGDLRAVWRAERAWGQTTMVEEFIVSAGRPVLEARVTIDWREGAHLLKLRFPVALAEPRATQQVPFGFVARPVDGAETPGQSWADLSGVSPDGRPAGLTVINQAKHGHDFSPADGLVSPSIGVTALRSPVYAWHDPRTLDPDGRYAYQDLGRHRFSYLLAPHGGDPRSVRPAELAEELALAPHAQPESAHSGDLPAEQSWIEVADGPDGFGKALVTAVKGAQDGEQRAAPDAVVRVVETEGRPARRRLRLPQFGRTLEVEFGPHQIRTFVVPTAPDQPIREVDLVEWPIGERARGEWREIDEP
jgi:alpha-mannosidase